jgi:hypothetical protein
MSVMTDGYLVVSQEQGVLRQVGWFRERQAAERFMALDEHGTVYYLIKAAVLIPEQPFPTDGTERVVYVGPDE